VSLYDRIVAPAAESKPSLFDRISESPFDGAVPQAMNFGSQEWALGSAEGKGYTEPMDNDLPGNMNARSSVAAAGTRWQNKRAARGRGDAIKALTPVPSMVKQVGTAEPGKPSPARQNWAPSTLP
jgi:hypothetical protein